MKRIVYFLLLTAVVAAASCGGRKKDAAYYEAQIDSIRKAEALRELKQSAGVYDDPVEQFFDTLQVRPLPIQTAGANIGRLAHFSRVPNSVASLLGYPVETPLRMIALPRTHGHRVVMLAEGPDSIPPLLSLVTLDGQCQPLDQLAIYEQRAEERGDEQVMAFNDYYITSQYEITLMFAFVRQDDDTPHFESARRYVINANGHFEETIIDIE